jgi:membrane-bound lytic murein transglycosylase D
MKFNNWRFIKLSCLVGLFLAALCVQAGADEVFSVPENLKDNVAFWKKIYTEISLKEAVIHDREYPMIIFKTVDIGNRKGRTRSRYVRQQTSAVKLFLKNMAQKKPSGFNTEEQRIFELYVRYADFARLKTAYQRVRLQQGQKERFIEGLERSGAYMDFIRSVFKAHNIPQRITFLPHVESSFNINAYSRVGAAGMWQFMRATGRLFSLKIDYRVDERRDPVKATIAAARLLRKNYEELKSWPLAITAYNHGTVSIKRAVRQTGSRDLGVIIEKYKNRRFKFASKNFYGCFLAASEIAANAEKYFPPVNYHPPFKYNEIKLESYLRPRTLAKHLGVPEKQLKALNPALRSSVFSRQLPIPRGYVLRLPADITPGDARQRLAAVPASVKKSTPQMQHYYTVRRGDTLYGISRRFRISTEDLIIANEIHRENRIYIGQVLRIPENGAAVKSEKVVKKEVARVAPSPAKPVSPTAPPSQDAPIAASLPAKPGPDTVVNGGQAPPLLASSPTPQPQLEIPAAQNIKTAPPFALEEKLPSGAPGEAFDATLYSLDTQLLKEKRTAVITVSVDESLGHYSEWLDTPVWRIRQLNRGRRHIKVNQKIKIPLKGPGTLEDFSAKRLEYHMAQEEDFYSQYQVEGVKTRTVHYGDTLWSICMRDEEIPIWLFKKYNRDIDIDNLKAKMKLTIPVVAPRAPGAPD